VKKSVLQAPSNQPYGFGAVAIMVRKHQCTFGFCPKLLCPATECGGGWATAVSTDYNHDSRVQARSVWAHSFLTSVILQSWAAKNQHHA